MVSSFVDTELLRKDMTIVELNVRTDMTKQHTRLILRVAGFGSLQVTLSRQLALVFDGNKDPLKGFEMVQTNLNLMSVRM